MWTYNNKQNPASEKIAKFVVNLLHFCGLHYFGKFGKDVFTTFLSHDNDGNDDDDDDYGDDNHDDDDDDEDVLCIHLAGWGSYNRGVYWKAIR